MVAPSLGWWACAWIETYLVHSQGDFLGRPFRLLPFQREFVWRCYELDRDGFRRYDRALWGLPKGNGKTEIAAALGLLELAGPVAFTGWEDTHAEVLVPLPPTNRISPDIPIAAASFDQAGILFKAAKTMIEAGPLDPLFKCGTTKITPHDGHGELYRVAAAGGTNDGLKPSFFVADELHEWEGKKEDVHTILANGVAKRAEGWELNISTAGHDVGSLLGRMVEEGESGDDPRLLYVWQSPKDVKPNLDDPVQLESAIREANPALGVFLKYANILRRWRVLKRTGRGHKFRRYYLNQWVDAPEKWLPDDAWSDLADEDRGVPEEGTEVVLGFDGSWARDATGLVGATLEERPHLFKIALQERPADAPEDWRVDVGLMEADIIAACARWTVLAVGCDPARWQRSISVLMEDGLPMVEWPTHNTARMTAACSQFEDAVGEEAFTHDGGSDISRHVRNATVVADTRGRRIQKKYAKSPKRIDLAVCAVLAYDLSQRLRGHDNWEVL